MKHSAILFCLLLAIGANSFTSIKAQVDVNDSLALVDLYNSTNGPQWNSSYNWLTTAPVSTWWGIREDSNSVISVDLSYNNLIGSLPNTIGNLHKLQSLNLTSNGLTGNIPLTIGNLINLQYVALDYNQLSGSIPTSIGNLLSLHDLRLTSNQLNNSIPPSIGNLKNLTYLYLDQNRLSGALPSSIGNLRNLWILSVRNNQLTDNIPSSIGNDTNLIFLDLSFNQLTGSIPVSFHNLSNLTTFLAINNKLSQTGNLDFPMLKEQQYTGVYIYDNYFTFDGLEFLHKKFPAAHYAPQANILLHQHGGILSVYAGGTLSKNTYKWFKVGQPGSTIIKGDSTFTPVQSGRYYVQVTNAIATQLTLHSDTIHFTINESIIAGNKITNISGNKAGLRVFPNPASNMVHVQTNGNANIVLTNAAGKIVLSKTIGNKADINLSRFVNGTYYLQNKTTGEMQKIVVTH